MYHELFFGRRSRRGLLPMIHMISTKGLWPLPKRELEDGFMMVIFNYGWTKEVRRFYGFVLYVSSPEVIELVDHPNMLVHSRSREDNFTVGFSCPKNRV